MPTGERLKSAAETLLVTGFATCFSNAHNGDGLKIRQAPIEVINHPDVNDAYILASVPPESPWVELFKAVNSHVERSAGKCDFNNIVFMATAGTGTKRLLTSPRER